MRAWGLNQPHARLVVDGVKRAETRPRPCRTLVGQRIAIHANLTHKWDHVRAKWPFKNYLLGDLAYGALIGTVTVVDCLPITQERQMMVYKNEPQEYALGDYTTGRWAFRLTDPKPFAVPVPWKGKQGVFMVPDQLVATAQCNRCANGLILVPTGCFNSEPRPCPECRADDARAAARADVLRETGLVI